MTKIADQMNTTDREQQDLLDEIATLKVENARLRQTATTSIGDTVRVPDHFKPLFDQAQETVGNYFKNLKQDPTKGTIEINDERYVLVRASALSYDFLNSIKNLYADRGEAEALSIGRNFLFDIAHLIGMEDAKAFHKKMNLTDPMAKLSAGPVHFAYSGWAFVEILTASTPSADENFFLTYHHPYSFEADSWIKAQEKSQSPVCIMNSGYSSGWCAASYGISLTAVEISCKACGDDNCTFIMAPPDQIGRYLKDTGLLTKHATYDIPEFFERKVAEEKLSASLQEKEVLLKEIHHRVKNNLQIISSLLNLQSNYLADKESKDKMKDSINRIQSMALIHEMLYGTKGLANVDIRAYLNQLLNSLGVSYGTDDKKIECAVKLNLKLEKLDIDKAVPFGLIINELVSNSYKHAFKGRDTGKISVTLEYIGDASSDNYRLIVEDDGVGAPKDLDLATNKSFGLELVNTLAGQLSAKIRIETNNGTKFIVDFK
ncbi:MAG: XylR N-terminal domain-containing protein [Flavobacteriales bacterium]|nr:XylR N-terminal domain-containing protein [Flavobacteriales bacterium]